MSSGIDLQEVDAESLNRVCKEYENMNDETIEAMCLLIEAEIVARKERGNNSKKKRA